MGGDEQTGVFRVGDVLLDVGARLVTRNGEVVPLPPKTFELFVTLVRRAPGVVKRQELVDTVWPNEIVNDEALTQRLMLLRRALGDDPKNPTFIASMPRWGYRLVAPVRRDEEPAAAAVTSAAAGAAATLSASPPAAAGTAPSPATPSADSLRPALQLVGPSADALRASLQPMAREARATAGTDRAARPVSMLPYRRRLLLWPLLLLAAAAAAVAAYVARSHYRPGTSLAVLPFTTVAPDLDTEVLADGVRESLTSALARLPNVRVIAASTMSRYKGKAADPQEVGRRLGVVAVLSARLARRGETLAISAELVSVADGTQLWGDSSVRPLADIFTLQEELAGEIAQALEPRLAGAAREALHRRYTEDVAAWQLYIKGRYHWNKRTEEGFADAIACFKQAIEEDPTYALAYAGLADCYTLLGATEYGALPPRDAMPKAKAAAARAIDLDPTLAEAYASLGLVQRVYEWDRATAEVTLRRAIELSPSYASARQWYAELLAELGREREAERELRRALELDPLSLVIASDLGLFSYYARDHEKAIQYYRAVLAMDQTFAPAHLGLALAHSQQGSHGEALAALEAVRQVAPEHPVALATYGYVLARAGRAADARAVDSELRAIASRRFVPAYYLAAVPVGLGDGDAAFAALDKACEERSALLGSLAVEPALDPLRPDPRFANLLRCVRLVR